MTFMLADPIPFYPWNYDTLNYTAALSLILALIAIRLFLSKCSETESFLHDIKYGVSQGLLVIALLLSVVFLYALFVSLIHVESGPNYYSEWANVNTIPSVMAIACNAISITTALVLLKRFRIHHGLNIRSSHVKDGHIIVLWFGLLIVVFPFLAVYTIGADYELSKYLLYSSVAASVVLILLSRSGKTFTKALMRWSALGLLLSYFLFSLCQPVLAKILLPDAQRYSLLVVSVLEKHKAVTGDYPDQLDYPPLKGKRVPYLIRQTKSYWYSYNKDTKTYSLHLYQDRWVHFTYSSASKKWQAWRSNLW